MFEELLPLATAFTIKNYDFYAVGGCVRDHILNVPSDDIDICTDATPDQVKAIIEECGLSCWTQGEKFGTIGTKILNIKVEITTYRKESYDKYSRKPEVTFSNTLIEDLERRDFTINTIAYDVFSQEQIDLLDGGNHLKNKILATPLNPEISFSDDPLRLMRAARFIAKYDLEPELGLIGLASKVADQILKVSTERICDEFSKILLLDNPMPALEFLEQTGVRKYILPSSSIEKFFSESDISLRLFEYFYPFTTTETRTWLKRLRFPNKIISDVCEFKDEVYLGYSGDPLASSRRWVKDYLKCDPIKASLAISIAAQQSHDQFVRDYAFLQGTEPDFPNMKPSLTGDEVRNILKINPSPALGDIMDTLMDDRIENGIRPKDEAIKLLREGFYSD